MNDFAKHIRNVPDFPIKGIQFKDITTLLKEPGVFSASVDAMLTPFADEKLHKIVGIESRGFIFGAALAYKLNIGFVPVRKPGKLPAKTHTEEYELEYGTDSLEIHADAIDHGEKVLVVDDLLATGGTAAAACRLVEKLGGKVAGVAFLIELEDLKGREKLKPYRLHSVMKM
jgi:adenine phosphoribosyltransferase